MSKKTQRSSAGLAEAMFDELDNIIEGKSNPQNARAKASIANTIISISRLEMDYARFVSDAVKNKGSVKLPSFTIGS